MYSTTAYNDSPMAPPIRVTPSRPLSPPILDLNDEVSFTPNRVGSWPSDATLARTEDDYPSTPGHKRSEDSLAVDFDFCDDDDLCRSRSRRRRWTTFCLALAGTLFALLIALDILLRLSKYTWQDFAADEDEQVDVIFSEWGKPGTHTEGLAWYPTDFLQDVIPKPIHSHNDYWRKVPLFTALKQGCISVEADVWLINDQDQNLYVGHDRAALQPERTFQSLYINPLVEILERQNPTTSFYNGNYRGVFDTAPNQTLSLLVDVKSAGSPTWARVVEQLTPLRERGWLSFYANGTLHERAITVIGSGATPFADLTANTTYRDYFFDAPLNKLLLDSSSDDQYNSTNSYYASVAMGASIGHPSLLTGGSLAAEQLARLQEQVKRAHELGLKVRYWDLPSWPVATRNRVWDMMVREGVDILNVDDVKGAAKRTWKF